MISFKKPIREETDIKAIKVRLPKDCMTVLFPNNSLLNEFGPI